MKSGLMKRMVAFIVCVTMLTGDILPAVAQHQAEQLASMTVSGNASVSGGDIVDGNAIVTLQPVTVDGVTITVSGPAKALKPETELRVTQLDPVAVEKVEEALAAEEAEKKITIEQYKAFDITLLVDGKEVQPDGSVKVSFTGDILVPAKNEDVTVYHVTDNAVADEMTNVVADNEVIEMETTHFSTYVITITGRTDGTDYTVTYEYYRNDGLQIFKPTVDVIKAGTPKLEITNLRTAGKVKGGQNYNLDKLVITQKKDNSGQNVPLEIDLTNDKTDQNPINITSDTVIRMIYSPVDKGIVEKPVTFFDYSTNGSRPGETTEEVLGNGQVFYNFTYGETVYENYVLKVTGSEAYLVKCKNVNDPSQVDMSTKMLLTPGMTLTDVDTNPWNPGNNFAQITYKNMKDEGWRWVAVFEATTVISGGKNNGINAYGYEYCEPDVPGNYLAMGAGVSQNFKLEMDKNGNTLNGNANNGKMQSAIVPNLVMGLTGDNYMDLVMGTNKQGQTIKEPGYFNFKELNGKAIYADRFTMNFEKEGDIYRLNNIYDTEENFTTYSLNGTKLNEAFFPLDKVPTKESINDGENGTHNWYFGMRYELTFRLGDYIGPLEYTFKGDDDLWAFVDGKRVMDLGGMHSAYPDNCGQEEWNKDQFEPNTVDLWKECFGIDTSVEKWWETYTYNEDSGYLKYDTHKEYQLTVLYMERGGYDSSCYMEFTVPDVEDYQVVEVPGTLEFMKEDKDSKAALKDVGFTLYTDEACTNVAKAEVKSAADGKVVFQNISEGTYYMKETASLEGYVTSNTVWKVSAKGNNINNEIIVSITLYQPDADSYKEVAKDDDGNYVIYNEKEEEETPDCKPVKTATVVDWNNRVYEIKVGAYHEGKEGTQIAANVVDYIDNRFEVVVYNETTKQYEKAANGANINGGTLTLANGSTPAFITWNNVMVGKGTAQSLGFVKSILVRAKETYLGGNAITTNVNDDTFHSGIKVEDTVTDFPQPKVNVNIDFALGEAEDTIFLGEDLSEVFTTEQQTKVSCTTVDANGKVTSLKRADGTAYDISDVNVTLVWKDANGNEVTAEQIKAMTPEKKTQYQAVVTATPKASVAEADKTANDMKGADGIAHKAQSESREGTYTVYVIEGELTIEKGRDAIYPDTMSTSQQIHDSQSFVFKIERYDLINGKFVKDNDFGEVYENISFDNGKPGAAPKKLVGLKKGYYKVTEEQEWCWKYKQIVIMETDHYFPYDKQAEEEHYLFIGNKLEQTDPALENGWHTGNVVFTEGKNTYFGASLNSDEAKSKANTEPAEIFFQNNKKKEMKWLGDVSTMVNKFVNP